VSGRSAELLALLQQQAGVCRELVELLQGDRELVVRHQIAALERSNERKQALVLQLQALEHSRQQRAEALALALELPAREARVSALVPRLGAEGPALEAAAANLRALVASLRELVAISHGFLEQSILGIRSILALLGSLREPPPAATYDASGRLASAADAGAIALRREA
jgi:flagellar biosynthesis/type III secretory pathway chaperone